MKHLLKMFGVLIVVIASNSNAQPVAIEGRSSPKLTRLQEQPVPPASMQQEAAKIKSDPRYNEANEGKAPNWAAKSFQNLLKLIKPPKMDSSNPNINPDLGMLSLVVRVLGWTALAALVIAFLYFVIRYFSWKATLAKRAKAVLDEEEPDRTLDEWLALANDFESRGMYREAVRCLYLACLMKFDERGVAFFDRGQTNWEHLQRIEASSKLPLGLSFRQPTQDFDNIWYGYRINGASDVSKFRGTYHEVVENLKVGAAA